MLSEATIKKNLKEDPDWEPDMDASDEDWDMFETIRDEMEAGVLDDDDETEDGESKSKKKKDWDDNDPFENDDADWDNYSEDY